MKEALSKTKEVCAKALRIFRRDIMKKDPSDLEGTGARMNALGFGVLLGVPAIGALAMGAFPVAAALFAGYLGLVGFISAIAICIEHGKKPVLESLKDRLIDGEENIRLAGPKSAVSILRNTQMLIDQVTSDFKMGDVPEKTMRYLQPYMDDAAQAAIRVKAARQSTPLGQIQFMRTIFNRGASVRVPYGEALVAQKELGAAAKFLRL